MHRTEKQIPQTQYQEHVTEKFVSGFNIKCENCKLLSTKRRNDCFLQRNLTLTNYLKSSKNINDYRRTNLKHTTRINAKYAHCQMGGKNFVLYQLSAATHAIKRARCRALTAGRQRRRSVCPEL